jgi:hypothetical protein
VLVVFTKVGKLAQTFLPWRRGLFHLKPGFQIPGSVGGHGDGFPSGATYCAPFASIDSTQLGVSL